MKITTNNGNIQKCLRYIPLIADTGDNNNYFKID